MFNYGEFINIIEYNIVTNDIISILKKELI